jgi:hypothetical protein
MDPGSRLPSRLRLWGRRIALVLLALVFGPPLLVRGPILRAAVSRSTHSLCGTFEIAGGHFGWLVVFDLLLSRPVPLEVHGLRVVGADGEDVIFAQNLSATVAIERHPWRITIDPAVVSHGRWSLAVDKNGGVRGLLGVFRQIAPGATRAACLTPPPRRGPRPSAPPAPSGSFVVQNAELQDLETNLDFPEWGLSLAHANGVGGLALGEQGGPLFTFTVRDVHAPSGTLRIGPGGTSAPATVATTTAHFDDVVISNVGVPHEQPTDILLLVEHADTGQSRLAGKAVFENVFAHHGRSGARNPPGIDLDAHWDRLADAAARLDAPWLPREALGELLAGSLGARLRGPFSALSGKLSLEGPLAGFEAEIERGERAALDVRATELALAPFLPSSLEPLLAGRVSGRLRAKVELTSGFRDADLEIPTADVTLTRDGTNREPRQIAFRVGAAAARPTSWRDADDVLVLGLTGARLYRRSLRLEGLSARWAELSARGALALEAPSMTKGPDGTLVDPPARVDAKLALSVTSIARWVPPETASARIAAEMTLAGPFDHLRARLAFAPSTSATILGEQFRAPSAVTAALDGRTVTLDRLTIVHVGGGRLEARGRAERGGGPIAGELRLVDYPLHGLPGLESVRLPAAVARARGHEVSLHDALAGQVGAVLKVSGDGARPSFAGTLSLRGVALTGRNLGDGDLRFRARGWTLALEGNLGPALALDLDATRRRDGGVTGDANIKLDGFALGPWLPSALAGIDVAASGAARIAVAPGRPLATHSDLRLAGAVGALAVTGSTAGSAVDGVARGTLELAGLRPLWKRALDDADGAIAVDVASSPGAPFKGTVVVARALRVHPTAWPINVHVPEGGRIDVDGTHVHVPGVTVTAAGTDVAIAGDVTVNPDAPGRSLLALTAHARLDAAALVRTAQYPQLTSSSGTIVVDARATGEARSPDASGTARFDGLEVHPRTHALPPLRVTGVVEGRDHVLTTRGLRVETLDGLVQGAVMIGAPSVPASIRLNHSWPPTVANLDLPIEGRGIRVGAAKAEFDVGALDLDLRLVGDPENEMFLTGDVGVARAHLDPFAGKKKSSGPARPWFQGLPPHLTLDLTVHGPEDALVVKVPVMPDVGLGFRCRVVGNARGGTITGRLRGSSAYSRLAIDIFAPKGTRECHVLKE